MELFYKEANLLQIGRSYGAGGVPNRSSALLFKIGARVCDPQRVEMELV